MSLSILVSLSELKQLFVKLYSKESVHKHRPTENNGQWSDPVLFVVSRFIPCSSQCSEKCYGSLKLLSALLSPDCFYHEPLQKMRLLTPTWLPRREVTGRVVWSRKRFWILASPLAHFSWVQPLYPWGSWWTNMGHAHWGWLAGIIFHYHLFVCLLIITFKPIWSLWELWHPVSVYISVHVLQPPVRW